MCQKGYVNWFFLANTCMSTSDFICFEYCFKISHVTWTVPATHNAEWWLSLSAKVSFNICRNSLWPCDPGTKWEYFPIHVYSVSENILYWYLKATVCNSTVPQHDHECEHCNHNTVNTSDWLLTITLLSLLCKMSLQENALCIPKQCEQLPSRLPGMFDTSTIQPRLPETSVATGRIGRWRIARDLSLWQVCLWIEIGDCGPTPQPQRVMCGLP
jgi:hypothetical protein